MQSVKGLLDNLFLLFVVFGVSGPVLNAQPGINDLLRLLPAYPDSAILVLDAYIEDKGLEQDSVRAKYFSYKALANYYSGNLYLSADLYERALETDWAKTHETFRGNLCNNLGIVYNLTARYSEAMSVYLTSLEIEENAGNALGAAQTKINIGLLHTQMGQYELAREILEEAKAFFESAENTEGVALAEHNLAMVCFNEGKIDEAEERINAAIKLYNEIGNDYEWVNVKLNLVRIELRRGNLKRANDLLDELEVIFEKRQFAFLKTQYYLLKSQLYFEFRDFKSAREYLDLVDGSNELITLERHELEILIAAQSGDLAAVKNRIDDLQVYRDSMNSINIGKLTNELHIQYGTERKVMQIQEQRHRLHQRNLALALAGLAILALSGLTVSLVRSNRRLRQSYKALFEKEKESQRRFDRLTTPHPAQPQTTKESQQPTAQAESHTSDDLSTPPKEQNAELWEQILLIMKQDEPYLSPDFRLADLATLCSSNRTYVSRCISTFTDQNFSAFINRYRVEKAKREMLEHPGYSFQAIGEQCGFRAGSSFFRVFKEQTGLTPSQYADMAKTDRSR